jgi:HAE1 family hydrophobic/amphiphilic exporter-1
MGAVPIMLGLGAGSQSRKPLGYAIVGGIFFSTLLTLFLVPVAYLTLPSVVAWIRERVRRMLGRREVIATEGD